MRTARKLEAEWRKFLRGRVGTGSKKGETSTGRVWVAGFHHVTARSRLASLETYEPFNCLIFNVIFGPRSTADN
jgi:head-tail adaptor